MRRLICAFIVRIWQKQVFLWLGSFITSCKGWVILILPLVCYLDGQEDKFELPRDKTNKMTCAPSKDSDQTGHPPSLIRVFAVRMKKAWILNYPLSEQRRLWSDWADAQADMSLCWAHMPFCWFCHEVAHLMFFVIVMVKLFWFPCPLTCDKISPITLIPVHNK